MTNFNFLIILVGLPASGKSTLAKCICKQLIEKYNIDDDQISIVDPDLIRNLLTDNNDDFDYNKEPQIREEALNKVQIELKTKNIVISDDLNYYHSMRRDLRMIAEDLNVPYFIVYVSTPIKICLDWNIIRGSPIPEDVIYVINEKLDKFDRYNWDKPTFSVDLSKINNIQETTLEILKIIEYNLELREKTAINSRKKITNESLIKKKKELDLLTRRIVSELIKKQEMAVNNKIISKFRKEFIKKISKSELAVDQILSLFKESLENKLTDLRK